jgi:hypothetical protein
MDRLHTEGAFTFTEEADKPIRFLIADRAATLQDALAALIARIEELPHLGDWTLHDPYEYQGKAPPVRQTGFHAKEPAP